MQIKHCRSHKLSYSFKSRLLTVTFPSYVMTKKLGQGRCRVIWNLGDKMVWLLATISHLCMLESLDWYVRS